VHGRRVRQKCHLVHARRRVQDGCVPAESRVFRSERPKWFCLRRQGRLLQWLMHPVLWNRYEQL
jgi:hypothetical protein